MLTLIVARGHGDDQCREQRLFFAREFAGERIDRQGMIQVNGEILSAEKLADPLVTAAFVDDEDHRIEP